MRILVTGSHGMIGTALLADETLLASTRTMPAKLQANGLRFRHPGLEGTLRSLLQNQAGSPTRLMPEHNRKEPP